MKKFIPVLIIILLLSACNFPGEVDYSEDPVVQTSVSMILTKGAQTQEIAPQDPTSIQLPVQTETPPAETQAQSTPTIEEAETATATQTEETSPEPSQTPSPTELTLTDPWSGEAAFIEEFDSGDYWDFESDYLYSKISNGQLEFTSKGTPWWSSWYTTNPEFKDGYFETTFSIPNCQGQDRFGLVIRWGGSGDFYYMGVTCGGYWGFTQYTAANETIDLVQYQKSDAFNPAGETNQIGILAKDNAFEFYINRQKVGSLSESSIEEGGNFGFLTMSSGTPNFKTLIDRLEYWTN
jgi:hypothetical protein